VPARGADCRHRGLRSHRVPWRPVRVVGIARLRLPKTHGPRRPDDPARYEPRDGYNSDTPRRSTRGSTASASRPELPILCPACKSKRSHRNCSTRSTSRPADVRPAIRPGPGPSGVRRWEVAFRWARTDETGHFGRAQTTAERPGAPRRRHGISRVPDIPCHVFCLAWCHMRGHDRLLSILAPAPSQPAG